MHSTSRYGQKGEKGKLNNRSFSPFSFQFHGQTAVHFLASSRSVSRQDFINFRASSAVNSFIAAQSMLSAEFIVVVRPQKPTEGIRVLNLLNIFDSVAWELTRVVQKSRCKRSNLIEFLYVMNAAIIKYSERTPKWRDGGLKISRVTNQFLLSLSQMATVHDNHFSRYRYSPAEFIVQSLSSF